MQQITVLHVKYQVLAINDPRGYQGMGNTHAFFILHDGRVMGTGWAGSGSLGSGNTTAVNIPTIISGLTNICMVACGYNDTFAVDTSGNAFHTGKAQIAYPL